MRAREVKNSGKQDFCVTRQDVVLVFRETADDLPFARAVLDRQFLLSLDFGDLLNQSDAFFKQITDLVVESVDLMS